MAKILGLEFTFAFFYSTVDVSGAAGFGVRLSEGDDSCMLNNIYTTVCVGRYLPIPLMESLSAPSVSMYEPSR